jgi:hypothetical protein
MYLGMAAAARTVCLHPLTVAMARKRVLTQRSPIFDVLRAPPGSTTTDAIRFVYRGFGVAVFANIFGETLYFGVLEYVRHHLEGSRVDAVRDPLGGFGAEFCSLALSTPFSVVCHRQMTAGFGIVADVKYGSALATVRGVTTNGYRGLFAGFNVAVTALPAGAMWWGIYSQSKHFAYSRIRLHDNAADTSAASSSSSSASSSSSSSMTLSSTRDNPVVNGACGLVASVITTIVFNPFNVVRTRIQASGGGSAVLVARSILKNEGASAFLKGAVVSSCSAAFEGAIVSSIYEYTKWLSDHTLMPQ